MINNMWQNTDDQVLQISSHNELLFCPGIWHGGEMHWLNTDQDERMATAPFSIKETKTILYPNINGYSYKIFNHDCETKNLRFVAMHQYFNPLEDDFAFIAPIENVLFHVVNQKVFLVNGSCVSSTKKSFTVLNGCHVTSDQFWKCMERGILRYQPMAKGGAASLLSFELNIHPNTEQEIFIWSIFGGTRKELLTLDKSLLKTH